MSYYKPTDNLKFVQGTAEQERALFDAARAGDELARETLIRTHLLFVAKEGRRWARGMLPDDEVISAANYALMRAYEKFDHTRGKRFCAFLRPFIRGSIANLWRSQNTVGEKQRTFAEKPDSAPRTLEAPVVHQEVETTDHEKFLSKLLEDAKQSVLTEKERAIINQHFGEDEIELTKIAKQLRLTRERVRQIKNVALGKLEREMKLRMKLAGVTR
jgi:RNA polymerase sigma factor (sigma-70 family)